MVGGQQHRQAIGHQLAQQGQDLRLVTQVEAA
jgi:hypothetical protein